MARSISSALLARFVAETGTNPRTARHYRATNNVRWLDWLAVNGTTDIEVPNALPIFVPEPGQSSCPVQIALEVERLALSTLRECGRQKALATQAGKPELVVGYTAAEIQAHKMYTVAHSAREKEELKAGRTIMMAEVEKQRVEFTDALRELFRAQPAEVAPMANPTDPKRAMRALDRWYADKLAPALAAMANGHRTACAAPRGAGGEEDAAPELSLQCTPTV